MKPPPLRSRTLALLAVLLPLVGLFIYVALRSGPLAPVPVTVTAVESRSITPALFGIGTVESRYTHKVGPTSAGRIKQVHVQVGDRVKAGQLLGEMDPVDFDQRIAAQEAVIKRATASIASAEALAQEASARRVYAETQAQRYADLLRAGSTSEEVTEARRQELQVADTAVAAARANVEVTRQEAARLRAEHDMLREQRANLRLIAPADGLVTVRHADPGSTVVAGQPVVEVIDPASVWINVRFEQLHATGLRAGLPARVAFRSQLDHPFDGEVLRVEPIADTVTEETLAKVALGKMRNPPPPLGELVEVTVSLPALPMAPAIPNASIQRKDGTLGAWHFDNNRLRFAPVVVGPTNLDGWVQIRHGLQAGTRIVVYSQRALDTYTRVKVVDRLPGGTP